MISLNQAMDAHTVSNSSLEVQDHKLSKATTGQIELTTANSLTVYDRKVYDIDTLIAIGRNSETALPSLKFSDKAPIGKHSSRDLSTAIQKPVPLCIS